MVSTLRFDKWENDIGSKSVNIDQIAGGSGLVPIIPLSVNVSSGSASVSADGTISLSGGVGTLTLNNVFTSAYENYRLVFAIDNTAGATDIFIQLTGNGTLNSSYNYARHNITASPSASYTTGQGAANVARSNGNNGSRGWVDIFCPANTNTKQFLSQSVDGAFFTISGNINGTLTSYPSMTFYSNSTFTTARVKLYGYR